MGDEDDELRRRFRELGAWYEHQADAVSASSPTSAEPRRPLRRGLVGLTALAAGVGVIVVGVAVNGLSPDPDDPEITIRPTTATSGPDPTPTLRPSPSPDPTGPSPTRSSSASPRPSHPTASAGSTTAPQAAGTASPSPGGGTGVTSAPGGGSGATTPVEVAAPAPVTVANGDFEQQAPLIGKILGASPPGWTGSSGTLGVGWPRYPSSEVPGLSGPTAMTLFGLVATPARQTIDVPVQGGATYQLTVAVGCRSTPEDFGGARLSILAGGVRVTSVDVVSPACGQFTDVSVSWTAPADQAGQPLVIEIAKINQRLVSYVDIDNVRLTAG